MVSISIQLRKDLGTLVYCITLGVILDLMEFSSSPYNFLPLYQGPALAGRLIAFWVF